MCGIAEQGNKGESKESKIKSTFGKTLVKFYRRY